jgi:hypothetical protein
MDMCSAVDVPLEVSMLSFVTRPTLTPKSNESSQHEFWDLEDSHPPEQLHQGKPIPEGTSLRDLPRHYVGLGSARRFLRQIFRELQEWTVIAVNSAQAMATAAMNILMLSVVALFAALAVLILMIRDQVMDKSPTPVVPTPTQLSTLAERGEQSERLT